jgi:hypothetical protein
MRELRLPGLPRQSPSQNGMLAKEGAKPRVPSSYEITKG